MKTTSNPLSKKVGEFLIVEKDRRSGQEKVKLLSKWKSIERGKVAYIESKDGYLSEIVVMDFDIVTAIIDPSGMDDLSKSKIASLCKKYSVKNPHLVYEQDLLTGKSVDMLYIIKDLLQCESFILKNLPEGLAKTQVQSILKKAKSLTK